MNDGRVRPEKIGVRNGLTEAVGIIHNLQLEKCKLGPMMMTFNIYLIPCVIHFYELSHLISMSTLECRVW